MNLNRVNSVLVTNVSGANTGTSLQNIANGDMLVLNSLNANLTGSPTVSGAAGNDAIRIAQGLPAVNGKSQFRLSSKIIGKNITSWKKKVFAAPVQQVRYWGYNGVGGALALEDSTEYRFRLRVTNSRHQVTPHQAPETSMFYTTGSTADNYAAASSFASKINANSSRTLRAKFRAGVISDGAITEFGATLVTTLINGSKVVSIAVPHSLSVGALVAFRGVVYKVAEVPTTSTLVLDRPYSGITEVIDPATTVDLVGTIVVGDYGLKVEALAIPTKAVDLYQHTEFDGFLAPINGDLGQEETKTNVAAIVGSGYWEQVRDMEFFAAGYRGITNRVQFPIDEFNPIAISTGTYTLYVIEHYEDVNVAHNPVRNPIQTVLAFDISGATTKAAAVEAILDSYMQSVGLAAV